MDPLSKSEYKENIQTKICAFYEKSLREEASNNSLMQYLNVSLTGLRGRRHPALSDIVTTREVQNCRIHLKMLAGDYFTYELKAIRSGGSPHCRCCPLPSPKEDIQHILTSCSAYSEIRQRIVQEYQILCTSSKSEVNFQEIYSENHSFCQFILDPASFNLQRRININDPILGQLFKLSRDFCYAVNSARMKILKKKENAQAKS